MCKKYISLFIATMMLLGTLVSCGVELPGSSHGGTSGTQTENSSGESLDIPETRYDGEELVFLTIAGSEGWATSHQIFTEELTSQSNNFSTAVYERNDQILQQYGVTIKDYPQGYDKHKMTVQNETAAPTGDFKAIATNVRTQVDMASSGLLWNLNSDYIEYLNLNKPWWDGKIADGLSINDKLFFATGDIMTTDNDATFIIMFNKQMVKDYSIPDLYGMVEDHSWTMDKLYEYEQLVIQDLDSDSKMTLDKDVYGLAYTGDAPSCFLAAGGITLCRKDSEDIPYYEMDIDRAQSIADLGKLIMNSSCSVNLYAQMHLYDDDIVKAGHTAFGENHALFYAEVMQSVTRMRNLDIDFGVLPFPKYNAEQASYYSFMHSSAGAVSIPRSVNDHDIVMVSSMLEAMAYYSVDTLTVEYYDINLKAKGSRDEKSAPMIDLILANRVYDLAYYFGWGNNAFGSLAGCLTPNSTTSVSSLNQRFKPMIKRSIEDIVSKMDKFDD